MAITVSEASYEPKSISLGPTKIQFVQIVALSGATAGTCTATKLKEIYHIIVPGIKSHTAAPTVATNVATLAFTVPAETAAILTYDTSVTVTAAANLGAAGNSVSLTVVDGSADSPTPVVAGSEIVTVSGSDITVRIDPTVIIGSTRTQVRQAINLSAAAAALVTATGTSATVAATAVKASLSGGVSGGFRGTAICVGR